MNSDDLIENLERMIKEAATSTDRGRRRALSAQAVRILYERSIVLVAPTPPTFRPTFKRPPAMRPRLVESSFPGWCCNCARPYALGEAVLWVRGRGASHIECEDAA